jgi:hypothetical protein
LRDPLNEPRPELYYGDGLEGYTDYPFLDDQCDSTPADAS